MKFYSEVTEKLYDSIDALEAAEKKVEEDKKYDKFMELTDKLSDAMLVCTEIAEELAKLTGKDFVIPEIIVTPTGNLAIADGVYLSDECKCEGECKCGKAPVKSEPEKETNPLNITLTCSNPKVDEDILNSLFGFSKGKKESKEPVKVTSKPNANVIKGKKFSDAELLNMLEILGSL